MIRGWVGFAVGFLAACVLVVLIEGTFTLGLVLGGVLPMAGFVIGMEIKR